MLFFTNTLISLIWIMSKVLFMVYKFGLEVRRWVVRKIYKWIKTLTLKQIESLRYTHVLYTKTPFSPVKSLILSFTQTQFFTVSCFVIKLIFFFLTDVNCHLRYAFKRHFEVYLILKDINRRVVVLLIDLLMSWIDHWL